MVQYRCVAQEQLGCLKESEVPEVPAEKDESMRTGQKVECRYHRL